MITTNNSCRSRALNQREALVSPGRANDVAIAARRPVVEEVGEADVVFDVIGGDILERSAALVRVGGTLVTITMPPRSSLKDGGRSSSSSNPTAPGSPTSPRG